MSTKDYKTRNEILISVSDDGAGADEDDGAGRRNIVRPARKSSPFLPRRGSPNFKYRFFDFGRFASGGDIPFSYAPAVTYDAKKYPTTTAAFGAAQWSAYQNFALSQNPATLAETFAFMSPDVIAKYAIRIRDKNFQFQTIKPGQNFTFNVHGFEYDDATGVLEFDGSTGNDEIRSQLCTDFFSAYVFGDDVKFTESADANGAGVEFSLKQNTDFFLMPRIVFELGRSYVNYYTPIEETDFGTFRTGILNLIYKPLPRQLFLTDFFSAANSQTLFDDAAFNAARAITSATPGGRLMINTTRTPEAGSDTILIGNSTASAGQFPQLSPPRMPYFYAAPGIRYASPIFSTVTFPVSTPPFPPNDAERQNFVAVELEDPLPFQLFAIAKQGAKTVYCWYKTNGFNGVFFGAGGLTIYGNTPA